MPHLPGTTRLERMGAVPVLVLVGEHDMASVPAASARAAGLLAEPGGAGLVLDLAETTYLDSSVLHLLVRLRIDCARGGRTLALHAPPGGRAWRVLHAAGLLDALPVRETRVAAVALVERGR